MSTRRLFRHRGSAWAGVVVRQAFAHASRALPVRRVAESQHVLAFIHPVPGFEPVHILFVPKLSAPSLMHLTDVQRAQISDEVELLAYEALDTIGFRGSGFLVLVNGGPRQDVRQVHFHLLTEGYELAAAPTELQPGVWTDLPDPSCEVHQVRAGRRPLLAGLTHAAETRHAVRLERRGYSIIWDARTSEPDPVVHLTAGKRRR